VQEWERLLHEALQLCAQHPSTMPRKMQSGSRKQVELALRWEPQQRRAEPGKAGGGRLTSSPLGLMPEKLSERCSGLTGLSISHRLPLLCPPNLPPSTSSQNGCANTNGPECVLQGPDTSS
jgi:hypothetical protein